MFKRVSFDYRESYFEHHCKVVEEKDVLNIDIAEGWLASIQRWWYGLFLLSRDDERARTFFMSSEAMKMERVVHFRQFKNRIHPLSRFRSFWDCLMLILFTTNLFVFHHNTSIFYDQITHWFQYSGVVIEMIIISDVIVNLFSGYIDQEAKKFVLNAHDGVYHYASTKLCIHLASAIPIQCFLCLRYGSEIGCNLCKINKFVETLKIISMFRLFRIYEYSEVLTREWKSYKLSHASKFFRKAVLGFVTMMKLIDLSDTVVLWTMISEGKIDDNAFISTMIRTRYVKATEDYKFYIFHYGRVFKSIYLFNFSNNRRAYYLDKLVSLISYLVANIFCFWALVEVISFINRNNFFNERIYCINNMLRGLGASKQFPDMLSHKMDGYLQFNLAKLKEVEDFNILFKALPKVLKREIKLTSCYHYMKRIPYFAEWSPDIVEDITLMLKEEIFLKNELIAEPWVPGEGLFILFVGEVAVYDGENEIGHLIDGDYFGELALVTDKEVRTSSILAINNCMILLLDKSHFRRYMRDHSDLFQNLKQRLEKKFLKSIVSPRRRISNL